MLWWESVAPLGCPVVPDVYWMLIGSSGESSACRAASAAARARGSPPRSGRASQSARPRGRGGAAAGVGEGQPVGAAEQYDPAQVGATRPGVLDHRGVVGCPEGG